MTAREDLLQAGKDLTASGQALFSPAELIAQARGKGSNYPDGTLRTHIVSHMCANAPANAATSSGEFMRVSSGLYRLNEREALTNRTAPTTHRLGPVRRKEPSSSPPFRPTETQTPTDWYWEGHVQSLVVSHLARTGWSIRRVADTASSEHGHDIDAVKGGERVLIEVKGYPTSTYARGSRQGEVRAAGSLGAQARTYFSNALLSGCVMRAENSDSRVVIAFPAIETYATLARRVGPVLLSAGIELWIVDQEGEVQERAGPV